VLGAGNCGLRGVSGVARGDDAPAVETVADEYEELPRSLTRTGGETGDLGGVLGAGVIGRLVRGAGPPDTDEASPSDLLLAWAGDCAAGLVCIAGARNVTAALLSAAAAANALLSATEGVEECAAGGDGGGVGRGELRGTGLGCLSIANAVASSIESA
jgi:hypothetical protein